MCNDRAHRVRGGADQESDPGLFETTYNRGDLARVDEVYASDVVFHSPTLAEPGRGPGAIHEFLAGFRAGFPNIYRLDDGKINEVWMEIDALAGAQRMGVVPSPGINPIGLIGWAFRTVVRFALLQARYARQQRSGAAR